MKTLTIVTTFIFLMVLDIKAQLVSSKEIKSKADSVWAARPIRFVVSGYKLQENYTQEDFLRYEESQISANTKKEIYCRLFREWGIEFWRCFPNDPRRFQWLMNTCLDEPIYFANIREGAIAQAKSNYIITLDTVAKNKWANLYQQYVKDFLASKNIDEITKHRFLLQQLTFGVFNKKWRNSQSDKFDIKGYIHEAASYIKKYPQDEESVSSMLNIIYRDKEDFGLVDEDINEYILLLKATEFQKFHQQAFAIESLMKLQKVPIQFSAQSTEGAQINLKKYRGKLVLLDFWSLGCTVCIEKMPEIKGVYDLYKKSGFQVISICISGQINKDKEKIVQIHEKIGADWPLTILNWQAGGMGRKIFDRYGWVGVPQLLLLDQEGKLIHYQGKMLTSRGFLEQLVKQGLESMSIKKQNGK